MSMLFKRDLRKFRLISLKPRFSTVVSLRGQMARSVDIWGYPNLEGEFATGILKVEARILLSIPQCIGQLQTEPRE